MANVTKASDIPYPLVEVEWRDSHAVIGGWIDIEEARTQNREPRMFSAGYLLADDKIGVVVANSVDMSCTNACSLMDIPRGCIVRVRKLGRLR